MTLTFSAWSNEETYPYDLGGQRHPTTSHANAHEGVELKKTYTFYKNGSTEGQSKIDGVGDYTVTLTLTGNDNYTDATSEHVSFKVTNGTILDEWFNKAVTVGTIVETGDPIGAFDVTLNANAKEASQIANAAPASVTLSFAYAITTKADAEAAGLAWMADEEIKKVEEGIYYVWFSVSAPNYSTKYVKCAAPFSIEKAEYQVVVLPGYLKQAQTIGENEVTAAGNKDLVFVFAKDKDIRFGYTNGTTIKALYAVDSTMGYRLYEKDGTYSIDPADGSATDGYNYVYCIVAGEKAAAENVRVVPSATKVSGTVKAPKVSGVVNALNVDASSDGIRIKDAASVLDMSLNGAKQTGISIILRADVNRDGKIDVATDAAGIRDIVLR